MIKIIKSTTLGLAATVLLSGCFDSQSNLNTSHDATMAVDATPSEIISHNIAVSHAIASKKRKKHKLRVKKIDLDKFCFKDNRSIHYNAKERCK